METVLPQRDNSLDVLLSKLPLRDGNDAKYIVEGYATGLSKLPLRDGNPVQDLSQRGSV